MFADFGLSPVAILAASGVVATRRATGIWKQLLSEYVAPPLDGSVREALEAFSERRGAELTRA